jgi:hypothetical protein
MRKELKRQKLEKAPRFMGVVGRSIGHMTCLIAVFALALVVDSANFSQAETIPIPKPRPSPDLATGTGGPSDMAPDPTIADTPTGLSPGALIDPTTEFGANFDLSRGTIIAPEVDTENSPGAPIQLGPDPALAVGQPLGSNPLLGVAPPTAKQVPYLLEARLMADGPVMPSGIIWRIFDAHPSPDNTLQLIGEAGGGAIEVGLSPGDYLVHAAYGRAGATKKISVGTNGGSDTVIINAGGLKLSVLAGNDRPLSGDEVSFDVYAPDELGSDERVLVISDAPPDQILGLNAAIYHVICRYGDANAVVRADIRVEAGNLTEATVYQDAARLTLKLVSEHGGEALANTSWSILTPDGVSIVESVGAFPSVVLAAGEYTAIADHQGRKFQRKFAVESGLDRDIEVIAN